MSPLTLGSSPAWLMTARQGVGNEEHRPLDRVQQALQLGSVVRHAPQGVGEDLDRVPFTLEPLDQAMSPKRRIFDRAVHENDRRAG